MEEFDAAQLNAAVIGKRIGFEYGHLKISGLVMAVKHEYSREPGGLFTMLSTGTTTLDIEGVDGDVRIPVETKVMVFL